MRTSGLFVLGSVESFDRFVIAQYRTCQLGCFALQVIGFTASFRAYLRNLGNRET